MRQIVYFSTAAGCQDAATIAAIWAVSREQHQREGLSGLLVAGGHRYLEVIEGPDSAVEAMLDRVRLNPRHVGVSVLIARRTAARAFADWSATYFAARDPASYATLGEMIERLRAMSLDEDLRCQLDRVASRFAVAPATPQSSPWTQASSYIGALPLNRRH